MADPHGIALSPDEQWLVIPPPAPTSWSCFAWTICRCAADGPGDHLKREIAGDSERFFRIPLGGRPLGLRFDRAGERMFTWPIICANAVQVVNLADRRVERTIELGGPRGAIAGAAGRSDLLRRPAAVPTAGTVAIAATTKEARTRSRWTRRTTARSAPIRWCSACGTAATPGPWFWHGRQDDFHAALRKSLTDTMQGPAPTDDDVAAMAAFLEAMPSPENSHRHADGELSEPAHRGQESIRKRGGRLRGMPSRTVFHGRRDSRRGPAAPSTTSTRVQHALAVGHWQSRPLPASRPGRIARRLVDRPPQPGKSFGNP